MMLHRMTRLAILLATIIFTTAAQASDVSNKMEAFVVQLDDEGKEVFTPAEEANPGSVMEYRLYFSNTGDKAKRDLAITGPIPADTTYVANTAKTETRSEMLVSIDGGKKWEAEPVKRTRVKPDGTEEEYVIPVEQYTHLRWYAKERLGSNQTQTYTYRVKLKTVQ